MTTRSLLKALSFCALTVVSQKVYSADSDALMHPIKESELSAYEKFFVNIDEAQALQTEALQTMYKNPESVDPTSVLFVTAVSYDILNFEQIARLAVAVERAHSSTPTKDSSKAVETALDSLSKSSVIIISRLNSSLKLRKKLPKVYQDMQIKAWEAIRDLLKVVGERENNPASKLGFGYNAGTIQLVLDKAKEN